MRAFLGEQHPFGGMGAADFMWHCAENVIHGSCLPGFIFADKQLVVCKVEMRRRSGLMVCLPAHP